MNKLVLEFVRDGNIERDIHHSAGTEDISSRVGVFDTGPRREGLFLKL